MARADAESLKPLALLLRQLREIKGVKEKQPGVFHARQDAFIQFHDEGGVLHAELKKAGGAGFDRFAPDACLVNRYEPGARLALHQDRDERDFDAPIVSVSLGVPATFLWGGTARSERPRRLRLEHADVVVWGGPARLNFHGIDTLRESQHPLTGSVRFNLTFRCALSPVPRPGSRCTPRKATGWPP